MSSSPSAESPPVPAAGMPHGWLRPSTWTLRAQLIGSMLALFAVITLATSAFAVAALDMHLTRQTDDQLRTSLSMFVDTPDGRIPDVDTRRRGPGTEGLLAQIEGSSGTGIASTSANTRVRLTSEQLSALALGSTSPEARTIDLPQLGRYRVMSGARGSSQVYVGLPTDLQELTVDTTRLTSILTALAGLVIMAMAGWWLVRRSLTPLTEVADTASRVTQLHLSSGQVALAERVPAAYTDSRTEVGKVGAALNELLDHVDEALNARHDSELRVRQFVADASHELRTPLASIRGYAELTRKEREPVPESVRHALDRVESEATRMSRLVEDLLLLARLDAGRPLEQERVDLTELVVNAVSDAHAASPRHKWHLDVPDEPVVVIGDGARLHQIIANLLANARVHTLPGTVVTSAVTAQPGWVRLSVHDDGPGIAPELQPGVFARFTRGDSARTRAGGSTGLGLSIVAAVASAHGGSVHLRSKPGDTTFSVLLPALAEAQAPHPASA